MKISTRFRNLKLILVYTSFYCAQLVSAQVLIPDLTMRDLLNEQIPGIVDAGGVMDTLHPQIPLLFSAQIFITGGQFVTNMEGVQYLDSLRKLTFHNFPSTAPIALICPALPPFLDTLTLHSSGTINLPNIPTTLKYLYVGSSDAPAVISSLELGSLPDGLEINLGQILNVNWQGVPNLNNFGIYNSGFPQPLNSIPDANIINLILQDCIIEDDIDLSNLSAQSINVVFCFGDGTITWPHDTRDLFIHSAYLPAGIGPLPDSLRTLWIDGSIGDYCLPVLPDSLQSLQLVSGFYSCLPNIPVNIVDLWNCMGCPITTIEPYELVVCSVLNTECPGIFPGLSGHVYVDSDLNGQFDLGEPGIPQASVQTQPSGYYSGCDQMGYWEMGVQPGSYTLSPTISYPYIQSFSPSAHTANVPNMGDADTLNDFAVTLMPNIQDLRAQLYAEPARPGFNNRLFLHADNYGTTPTAAQLTLNFDADQTWVGSSVAPTSMTGNTAVWDLATLDFAEQVNLTVDLTTAASVPLGTPLAHTLTADPVSTDQTPLNNVIFYNDSVVGSYDPNDKLLIPEKLPLSTVQGGYIPLEYTIRFQNTGTYPAERVIIVDTLSEELQWNSFEFLSSSHPCHWYITDGVLHFIHEGIVLPDSTNDEPNSHGYVKFRIKPSTDLQLGATVTNIAHIVFDFNEPIVTPPAVFTIDELTGVEELSSSGIAVYPNPVADLLMISFANTSPNGTYVIRNVLGQSVMQSRLNGNAQVDVHELHQGQYAIEVITDDAKYVQRFVKK